MITGYYGTIFPFCGGGKKKDEKKTKAFYDWATIGIPIKISYFFTCLDIANQLLTRHLPLAPLGQVDKWTVKPSRFSIQVVCRSFWNYGGWNTKKSVSLTDCEVQTFLEDEGNQYTKRKTESYIFSGFGVSIFLGWNENRELEDLPLADFGRLLERLPLSVRAKSINENFVNWKLRPLLFL